MTQIQALENMSQPEVVALYQELLQRYDDDIATLSRELASRKCTAPEGQAVVEALNSMLDAAHPAYIQERYFQNKLIKARDKAFQALEKNRLDQKEKAGGVAAPTAPVAAQAQWIEHCKITDIPDAVLTPSGLAIKSEQANTQEPNQALLISLAGAAGVLGLTRFAMNAARLADEAAVIDKLNGASPTTAQLWAMSCGYPVLPETFVQIARDVLGRYGTSKSTGKIGGLQEFLREAKRAGITHLNPKRACCNSQCGWQGYTDRLCGSVGPLCPECGETTEPICSCPGEGDGSLRWPCPVHPPESVNLTKSSNQQV